jgi:hypothetical protein
MATGRARLPRRLQELANALARMKAIHIVADVEFSGFLDDAVGGRSGWHSGVGRYEAWEKGGRYRISVDVGQESGLSQVVDVAYDGHLWQMYMQDSEMLAVSTIPSRARGTAFRNPLFLPFELLGIDDWENCALCELTLADFQAAGPTTPERPSGFSPWLEGRPRDGVATRYQITLDGRNERLARIEHVDLEGRALLRMSFDGHRRVPGGRAWFPSRIDVEFPREAGLPPHIRRYRITVFEVDPEIGDERFIIRRGVRRLVDSDRNRFLPLPKPQ